MSETSIHDDHLKASDEAYGRVTIVSVYRETATKDAYTVMNGDGLDIVAAISLLAAEFSTTSGIPLLNLMAMIYNAAEEAQKDGDDHG